MEDFSKQEVTLSKHELDSILRFCLLQNLIEEYFLKQDSGYYCTFEIDKRFGENSDLFFPGFVFRIKDDEFYISEYGYLLENPYEIASKIEENVGLQTRVSDKNDIVAYKIEASEEIVAKLIEICNSLVMPQI
ncbi:MAG: hypothetical protein LBH98_09180 [Chitinispirillales bacterium]|jgi:hypothetical protein|nr:hypothetical protein [Chitinispirillales bacterium]